MDISAISGFMGVQRGFRPQNAERTSSSSIENIGGEGDKRLSQAELSNKPELANRVNTNGDIPENQRELFGGLIKRLEEQNNSSLSISFNINVIKANIGSLVSSVLGRSDSSELTNLFNKDDAASEFNLSDVSVRERYIKALFFNGSDSGSLLTSKTSENNAINLYSTTQNDGSQLLLNFLIEELGTPRQDAVSILDILQNQSFQTVA